MKTSHPGRVAQKRAVDASIARIEEFLSIWRKLWAQCAPAEFQ